MVQARNEWMVEGQTRSAVTQGEAVMGQWKVNERQ